MRTLSNIDWSASHTSHFNLCGWLIRSSANNLTRSVWTNICFNSFNLKITFCTWDMSISVDIEVRYIVNFICRWMCSCKTNAQILLLSPNSEVVKESKNAVIVKWSALSNKCSDYRFPWTGYCSTEFHKRID